HEVEGEPSASEHPPSPSGHLSQARPPGGAPALPHRGLEHETSVHRPKDLGRHLQTGDHELLLRQQHAAGQAVRGDGRHRGEVALAHVLLQSPPYELGDVHGQGAGGMGANAHSSTSKVPSSIPSRRSISCAATRAPARTSSLTRSIRATVPGLAATRKRSTCRPTEAPAALLSRWTASRKPTAASKAALPPSAAGRRANSAALGQGARWMLATPSAFPKPPDHPSS